MTMPPYSNLKPGAPRTIGTLSLVFGSIVAALSLFGLVAGTQLGMMMQPDGSQRDAFERYSAEIHWVGQANNLALLAMSVLLIYISRGQRSYARWAAAASVKWGVAGLAWLVITVVLHFIVVAPAMDEFVAAIGNRFNGVPMGGIMKFGALIGYAFYAPYPIILLVTFRKPHIVAAMSEPPLPTAIVQPPR
jgi:hypothetical protein